MATGKVKIQTNKNKKPFKPCNTPRLLVGSVDHVELRKDLESYNQHLWNVHNATTKIDAKPPKFHALKYLKMIDIVQTTQRLRALDQENKDMLKKINLINREGGKVDTWNPFAHTSTSKWRFKEIEIDRIRKENYKIYKRILKSKSQYPKAEHDSFYTEMEKKMLTYSKYPHYKITTKDDELKTQASITDGLNVATHPENRTRCYLVFQIADCNISLGKLVIELYNDICPKTCENFLALMSKTAERTVSFINCPVHKIYKHKYMITGDITKGTGKGGLSSTGEELTPENFTLKHARAGVLSMLTVNGKNNSQFCITFDAIPNFNGKQVAFGKVIKGAANLFKINDFGRQFGKPITNIIISKCGIIKGLKSTKAVP